jgi:HlyD family secretion protein
VHEGESLVRIANLGSFKVSGTLSDSYLDQLHKGMTAIVRINDSSFRGQVTNVNPSVQNGLISFDVQLNDRVSKFYRPNLKVDVFLVTATRDHVLRVANGPAFKGGMAQEVFVVEGNKARRRTVHVGLSNFDYVELKDHVKPGDVVITSDMSNYKNMTELTIRN